MTSARSPGTVKTLMAAQQVPAGYSLSLQGETSSGSRRQRTSSGSGSPPSWCILLLLQAAFRSWRLAWLLMLTLPMALVGGVLAAWGTLGTITLGALVGFFTVLGHRGPQRNPPDRPLQAPGGGGGHAVRP